ncbi:deoxyribonuclease IV [Paenibacillus oenotherae]|uniref:Deoxyribonuclease IV n=1 Tax=Paenibacillus oenotherae TaxID=1435645 RepID=A0ABS7DCF4_9BACL|nr:deoxyribonuclease IV [Paenibacillus oenotherae]MBW7477603.1 deoxyribonuclease IV [Paenibacillus oenotherae]
MLIGYHVSTRGGYREAAKRAHDAGARAFQYFPKNPRSLSPKSFDAGDAGRCAEYCQAKGIVSIAHSPYPTNVAAEDPSHLERSVLSLLNDLDIAEACGSLGVVVHFGVYKGKDPLQGYRNAVVALSSVAAQWHGRAKLLIENGAGDHTFMGTTMEELAQIRSLCADPHKIGFCLDTCHLFASGVWDGSVDAEWFEKAKRLDVLQHVAAIHLNDSVYPSGAKRDRHAVIGEGHIGAEGMRWLLGQPAFAATPFILETPSGSDGTHRMQLELVRQWGGDD